MLQGHGGLARDSGESRAAAATTTADAEHNLECYVKERPPSPAGWDASDTLASLRDGSWSPTDLAVAAAYYHAEKRKRQGAHGKQVLSPSIAAAAAAAPPPPLSPGDPPSGRGGPLCAAGDSAT